MRHHHTQTTHLNQHEIDALSSMHDDDAAEQFENDRRERIAKSSADGSQSLPQSRLGLIAKGQPAAHLSRDGLLLAITRHACSCV